MYIYTYIYNIYIYIHTYLNIDSQAHRHLSTQSQIAECDGLCTRKHTQIAGEKEKKIIGS